MGRSCAICVSPDRAAIDRELSSGGAIAHIAAKREISPDSLKRHRTNHLLPVLRKALESDPELANLDPLDEVRTLYHRLNEQLDLAEVEGENWQAVRAFYSEARKTLELLSKLMGELDERPQVNVLISPRIQQVILEALRPHQEARRDVARAIARVRSEEQGA